MVVVATIDQLDRMGNAWAEARRQFATDARGNGCCARFAELGLATATVARRLGRGHTSEQVLAQTLSTLKTACAQQPRDLPRHLAFARVLEAAATHEEHDARAAFDAFRAAAAVLDPFASAMSDPDDPLARLAVTTAILRPLSSAARMLDDAHLRRQTWQRCWDAAFRWAEASKGGPDHAQAVEWVVLLAFELAVDELESSAGACLERCEDLRTHLDALEAARAGDTVCLLHRTAFQRLWSDAWHRLGDMDEAARALDECDSMLARLDAARDADSAAISLQRAAVERDRARLMSHHLSRRNAAATGP